MANLVIDASIAVAWCFAEEQQEYAGRVLRRMPSTTAFVPALWAYEIRNAALMGVRRGRISIVDAVKFLESVGSPGIQLVEPVSYDAIFRLAELNGLTVCDAAYLDLAIRAGAALASLDSALCQAALRAGIRLFDLP